MIKGLEEQILQTCRFCNPPEKDRILYETDNFYIMLSLGPITEGYSLLVSKQHFACCGAIPREFKTEFKNLYVSLRSILTDVFGACICYEHGRAGSCLIPIEGSKHCFHSHMHFVPASVQLNKLVKMDFDEIKLETLDSFFDIYEKLNSPPYLYVDDTNMNFYGINENIRRQYLRYLTARSIGREHLWDWVNYQGWDLINSAQNKLHYRFKEIKI
jgi:diadenosine tetraphosphate (Ap4A) HIT family hydrolase